MKFICSLIIILITFKGWACDSNLESYEFECNTQNKYQPILSVFNKLNIYGFEINGMIFKGPIGKLLPNDIALKENEIKAYQYIYFQSNSFITVDKIINIEKILTNGKNYNLRTFFGITNTKISFDCNTLFLTPLENEALENFSLTTYDGKPYFEIANRSVCNESQNISGDIIFIKGAMVKSELNAWIVDFNDTIKRFENGEKLEIGPYEYLSNMVQWFSAIHPFVSNNEYIASMLMAHATHRLHLPIFPKNNFKETLLTSKNTFKENNLNKISELVKFQSGCAYEYIDQNISHECTYSKSN